MVLAVFCDHFQALDPPTYMEPDALQSNFMHSFLSSGGPRVHHVTFKVGQCIKISLKVQSLLGSQVPNLDDAIARARDNGWKVVGVNKELPSWHEAFIHPKQVKTFPFSFKTDLLTLHDRMVLELLYSLLRLTLRRNLSGFLI